MSGDSMKKVIICFMICLLFAGCKETETDSIIESYSKEVEQMSPERLKLQKELVRWYNGNLYSDRPDVGFERSHDGILNIVDGMMGYVEIPGVEQIFPIYHDLRDDGFYSEPYSPFPSGIQGEHAELYTMLPLELQKGDIFSIHILDEVFTYQIEAEETEDCKLNCDGVIYFGTRIVED